MGFGMWEIIIIATIVGFFALGLLLIAALVVFFARGKRGESPVKSGATAVDSATPPPAKNDYPDEMNRG